MFSKTVKKTPSQQTSFFEGKVLSWKLLTNSFHTHGHYVISFSLSFSVSFFLCLFHSLSLSFSVSFILCLFHSLSLSFSVSFILCLFHSMSLSFYVSFSLFSSLFSLPIFSLPIFSLPIFSLPIFCLSDSLSVWLSLLKFCIVCFEIKLRQSFFHYSYFLRFYFPLIATKFYKFFGISFNKNFIFVSTFFWLCK